MESDWTGIDHRPRKHALFVKSDVAEGTGSRRSLLAFTPVEVSREPAANDRARSEYRRDRKHFMALSNPIGAANRAAIPPLPKMAVHVKLSESG
jgi:hypothetical protein